MGSLENPFFRRGWEWVITKKTIYRGELPKKGGLNSLQIYRRGLGKKEDNSLQNYTHIILGMSPALSQENM